MVSVVRESVLQVSVVTVSTRENFRETTEFGRGEGLLCYPIDDNVDLFAIRLKVQPFFFFPF